ncbi:MAG: hypothetical protein V1800_17600 [Candidatus Latescibacterota bacterium]
MKMVLPVLLSLLVGIGTTPYVFGLKKAFSGNPFIYVGLCNLFGGIVLLAISFTYGGVEKQYVMRNALPIGFSVLGIVMANICNYFVVARFGASYWLLASLSMMLVPTFVLGYLVFKESFNSWIVPCIVCTLLAVLFFGLSKR